MMSIQPSVFKEWLRVSLRLELGYSAEDCRAICEGLHLRGDEKQDRRIHKGIAC